MTKNMQSFITTSFPQHQYGSALLSPRLILTMNIVTLGETSYKCVKLHLANNFI